MTSPGKAGQPPTRATALTTTKACLPACLLQIEALSNQITMLKLPHAVSLTLC